MKSKVERNRPGWLLIIAFGAVCLMSQEAMGQGMSWSPTDNGKNAAYVLPTAWGTDEVNLYNGRVAVNVPLGTIGGRGDAAYQPTVSISRTFVMRSVQDTISKQVYWWTQPPVYMVISENYMDSYDYSNFQPGLLPAVMISRSTRDQNPRTFGDPSSSCGTLTKIYLRLPGSEVELRDVGTNGEPDRVHPLFNRGRAWHAVDGSDTYFLSDTDIKDVSCNDHDWPAMNNAYITYVTGYLMLKNGTRYRFVKGFPVWMRDRNGNTLTFGGTTPPNVVTDSIGRQYQIGSEGLSYKGVDGATRTVGVERGLLESALRADIVAAGGRIRREEELFPTSAYLRGPKNPFNPSVIQAIRLPNGLRYRFFYNEYGELARIEMPAGGIVEYDYPGLGVGQNGCDGGGLCAVYRPVKEKRLYDGANNLISRTTLDYLSPGGTTVKTFGPDGAVMRIERHTFKGSVGDDLRSTQWYQSFDNGRELSVETLDEAGQVVLRRTDNTWKTLDINGAPTTPPSGTWTHPTNFDCALTEVKTTLETKQTSLQTFAYDGFGNQTDVYEYDFGSIGSGAAGPFVRRGHADYIGDSAYTSTLGSYILSLPAKKWISSDSGGANKVSMTQYEYDNYNSSTADPRHAALIPRSSMFGHCLKLDDTNTSCLESAGVGYVTRGNLTQTTAFFDIAGNRSIQNSVQYDIAGNAVETIDGRGNPTTVSYDDAFGASEGVVRGNSAPAELNGAWAFAFPTSTINAAGHTNFVQYNYYRGVPVDNEDANGTVTIFEYGRGGVGATNVDPLDRPSKVIGAANSSIATSQTSYSYDDAGRTITTTTDLKAYGDNLVKKQLLYDGFGRTTESRQYEGGANYIVVLTQYDALSRPSQSSNPFRLNEQVFWTTTTYDALGRTTKVTKPGGAVTSTVYEGNAATTKDPAGKATKSVSDALGRLTDVYEDPTNLNYKTTYTYDGLDDLIRVTQDKQDRFFMYDSLKRLIRAKNPEQDAFAGLNLFDPLNNRSAWSEGYEYDANGNLSKKTDARGVTSEPSYDALDRVTKILYRVNGQPDPNTGDIEYLYDNAANGKGRLWLSYRWGQKPSQTAVGSYDALGRITQLWQLFGDGKGGWSAGYEINRSYNRAGAVTSQTYPSRHTVSYDYDEAGRTSAFTGTLGDGLNRTYASAITYSVFGGLQKEEFGTTQRLNHNVSYNRRGQLFYVALGINDGDYGKLIYYYGNTAFNFGDSGPDNNGNITLIDIHIPGGPLIHDHYDYDQLNRLDNIFEEKTVGTTTSPSFKQKYAYDRWGNRTINQLETSGVDKTDFVKEETTNRLYSPGDFQRTDADKRIRYDAAGNQIRDSYTGFGNAVFDAENHIASIQDRFGGSSSYTHNAAGQRVRRNVANQETWQIYGIDGELLAEYAANGPVAGPQREYGYRNGELLVTADAPPAAAPPVASTQNVIWTNPIGVSVSSNSLTKTAVTAWGNAGAASTQTLTSGDGYVEFTASEVTNYRMCGLSRNDVDPNYTSIDFAIYPTGTASSNHIYVYESGVYRGDFGVYASGDRLRVAIVGGVVKYSRNGTVLYTSTVAPSYPLRADTALHNQGSTISNAVISGNLSGGTSAVNVIWTNPIGVSVSSNSLTKAGADGWGNSGASSQQSIASGDGYVEVTASENNTYRMMGLSKGDSNQDFTDIDFAVYFGGLGPGSLCVFEAGANRGCPATFVTGDKIRVAVESGVVTYKKNGSVFYTSTGVPAYPLLVDTALYSNGATLTNFVISGSGGGGTGSATVQWLVTDHLGTPRMIVDQTGALAKTSRHDYLPFGGELFAGTGGRTPELGYVDADKVRQKFTDKERDTETGLDYFGARYYASMQGRFSSTDPVVLTAERLRDPQQINLYAYCRNNPLAFIDPDGETITFENDNAQKKYDNYVGLLNSNTKKYAKELATVDQLQKSEVEYHLSFGGQDFDASEGNTTTDGKRINIAIADGKDQSFSLNSRIAHELEHGRQFDSGELTFFKARDGKWHPSPATYDIGDEVKAWQAQLDVSTTNDFFKRDGRNSLLRDFSNAKTDEARARVLTTKSTGYRNRNPFQGANFIYGGKEDYKPGQLIRTANTFGRVKDVLNRPK